MVEPDEAATRSAANPDPDAPSIDVGHRLVRFRLADGWQVDPSLNRLDGPTGSASLHPKAMEVLVALADRAGEVVSKDDLLAEVWPGTFVSDQVLANAVWELRRAFGDAARSPRFIQTVPKRGYRLLVDVLPEEPAPAVAAESVAASAEPEAVDNASEPPAPGRRSDRQIRPRRWLAVAAGIVGVVLVVLAAGVGVDSVIDSTPDDRGTRSDEAWAAYQQGLRSSEGVREDALDHLRHAIELDPEFAAAHAALADIYDRQGATDLASAAIDRAIDLADGRTETERVRHLRLRARIHEDLQAEEMWLRRLAVLDDDPEVRFDLAWFLFTHFRYCDEALVGIRGVLEVDPRPHFLLYLGEVAMSCGFADEALDALARAVDARPDEAALHGFRSYLQRLAGDVEAAERSTARALELAPDDPWIAHRQALVLHRRYRFDEALSAFRRARGLQRGARGAAASAWAGEAIVHLDRARFSDPASRALDEADEAADRILALVDPPSPEALAIRGLVDVARGDLAAARERLDALDRHFESTVSRYDRHYRDHLRGRLLGAEGRWREAATAHADAVRNRPLEAADHRLALARAQLGAGEIEEAVGGLYRLFDLDPNHAEGRCLAAEAHERAGRPRAAAAEWDACARLADALGVDELFTALEALARSAPTP